MNSFFKDGQRTTVPLVIAVISSLALTGCKSAPQTTEQTNLSTAIKATRPLAYYRLESSKGPSEVGATGLCGFGLWCWPARLGKGPHSLATP